MKIIEMLTEQESSKDSRKRSKELGIPYASRYLNRITAGDYQISIQASDSHYCTPRRTLENLEEYDTMEIAIFQNGEWVQPRNDEKFQQFPRYEELVDHYEEGDCAVGGFVPVDLIQDLYDYLSK